MLCGLGGTLLLLGTAPRTADPPAPTAPTIQATQTAQAPTPYVWDLPTGFPEPLVPEANPMSAAKVALGRHLFYDTRLSGNGTQSCASCHEQDKAFSDGRTVAVGSTQEAHLRNAQSLVNAAYNPTLAWANPGLTALEQQVLVPLFGEAPVELGLAGKEQLALGAFRQDARYRELFTAAFPRDRDPYTVSSVARALASFTRTLILGSSPYDRYVYGGERGALSASAVRGMTLFFSERTECHHCHGSFNFSDSSVHAGTSFLETPFHNTGLYNVDGGGAYPKSNRGLYELTGKAEDMGRFRTPSLRNVALSAPYFHDGSARTLAEVVRVYEAGGRVITAGPNRGDGRQNPYKSGFVGGFSLTDRERTDLVSFLKSLTDPTLATNPDLSDPFAGR